MGQIIFSLKALNINIHVKDVYIKFLTHPDQALYLNCCLTPSGKTRWFGLISFLFLWNEDCYYCLDNKYTQYIHLSQYYTRQILTYCGLKKVIGMYQYYIYLLIMNKNIFRRKSRVCYRVQFLLYRPKE